MHACGSSSSKSLCFRDFLICDREASLLAGITEYTFNIDKTSAQHVVLGGDVKTYLRLKELKQHYGNEIDWLFPFIGDWHVL